MIDNKYFWKIRSLNYNKLKWVNDNAYLNLMLKMAQPNSDDLMLDVGTGSGKVARAFKPHVKHVIGLDVSVDMMNYDNWNGMSKILSDIENPILANNSFNLITARMVFHHVSDVFKGLKRCYDLLKPGGRILIAESIPPSDDPLVYNWWKETRLLKETRHVFKSTDLQEYLQQVGFIQIITGRYISDLEQSSTKNWLKSSGMDNNIQKLIYELHLNAPTEAKQAHRMKILKNDILCEHHHMIIIGYKSC